VDFFDLEWLGDVVDRAASNARTLSGVSLMAVMNMTGMSWKSGRNLSERHTS
jgi:hypothetical protein